MLVWIDAMPFLEKVFFFVAFPATLIMLIQTISLFFGGDTGDSGLDSDTSGLDPVGGSDISFDSAAETLGADFDDVHMPTDVGLRFITVRGVITFMTVFGWAGVCFLEMGFPIPAAIAAAIVLGTGALVGVAFLIRGMMGLQANVNINYREALGKYGEVYLSIPPNGEGQGKVTLTLSGALSQFDAVTDGSDSIKTGDVVRVTDIVRGSVMVVEREH